MVDKIEFPGNIIKVKKDGTTALSNYLEDGETIRGDGMTFAEAKAALLSPAEGTLLWKEDANPPAPGSPKFSVDETVTHGGRGFSALPVPGLGESKAKWYAYAVSMGYKGASEDTTKAELVTQYGPVAQ